MYHAYYFVCISAIAISLGGYWFPRETAILYGLLTGTFVIAFSLSFHSSASNRMSEHSRSTKPAWIR